MTSVSFFAIFYIVILNSLREHKEETKTQFSLVENYIYSSIANAEQVINGLVFLISKTSIKPNNQDLFELINNFDPQPKYFKAIPFSALVCIRQA